MKVLQGAGLKNVLPYFQAAADIAKEAACTRARCGTVIVKDGRIIGRGSNGPPLGDESRRTCGATYNLSKKPKYDKTCCIHAEWRAILNACKDFGHAIEGADLYFMRVDGEGNFTDAGQPFCTVCSRLAMESGIATFALWDSSEAKIYNAAEYDAVSYNFYHVI